MLVPRATLYWLAKVVFDADGGALGRPAADLAADVTDKIEEDLDPVDYPTMRAAQEAWDRLDTLGQCLYVSELDHEDIPAILDTLEDLVSGASPQDPAHAPYLVKLRRMLELIHSHAPVRDRP